MRPRGDGELLRPGARRRVLYDRASLLLRAGRDRLLLTAMTVSLAGTAPPPWESLRGELVRFVRARVGDETTADDIAHDVLLRALAELQGPRPPVHLRGWLYRVARNALADHFRRRRPTEELPADLTAATGQAEELAERELAGCLTPQLATLPARYREALTLAEIDGLAQREIAARARISLSGAKSRVQRARAMLRAALLDCCRVEVDRRGGVVDFEGCSGGSSCPPPSQPAAGPAAQTSAGSGCRSCTPRA